MTTSLIHSSCNDGVIQLSPLSSYAVLEFVKISHACFVYTSSCSTCLTHCSQLDLNQANLEATVEAEPQNEFWRLSLFLLAKTAFFNDVTITSSLHSVVQVLMGLFTIFQYSKIMKSCQNLSKLWSEYCQSLLFGHGVYYYQVYNNNNRICIVP